MEGAFLGADSPGPNIYNGAMSAKVKAKLSVTKQSKKYSIGKEERFKVKKRVAPSPVTYKNTNEVSSKMTLRHNGAFSMPRGERKFDFVAAVKGAREGGEGDRRAAKKARPKQQRQVGWRAHPRG